MSKKKEVNEKILTKFLENASPIQIKEFNTKKSIIQKYKYLLNFSWLTKEQYNFYIKKEN